MSHLTHTSTRHGLSTADTHAEADRDVRRATLASVCIPGYQVPYQSDEPSAAAASVPATLALLGTTALVQNPSTVGPSPLMIQVLTGAHSDALGAVEQSAAECIRRHGEADYARMWVALYEDLVTGGAVTADYGHPVMVHERYLMTPTPIPHGDLPRLNDAAHLTVFSQAGGKKIYAVPPHTKVEPLVFDDVAFDEHARTEPRRESDQPSGQQLRATRSPRSIQTAPGEPWILRVDGLTKVFDDGFHDANAVTDVSFDIAPGETLAIQGEPGAGKSTLLKCLIGDLLATEGQLYLSAYRAGRHNVFHLPPRERRTLRLATLSMVYQDPAEGLDLRLSVGGNIADPLTAAGERSFYRIRERAAALLDRVELPSRCLDEVTGRLPQGARQRVQIAKALANDPDIMLLDEPTSGLVGAEEAELVELLVSLQAECGTALVITARESAVLDALTDRVAELHQGRLLA